MIWEESDLGKSRWQGVMVKVECGGGGGIERLLSDGRETFRTE